MARLSEAIQRRRIERSQPVYDPTYVYRPWVKWIVISAAIATLIAIAWYVLAQHRASGEVASNSNATLPHETEATTAPNAIFHPVEKIVDGDTIDVSIDGRTERLRLIGIDTPEIVDPRKTVQCFGKEASAMARSLLDGQKVRLEQDASQGERDKYGRMLTYIFLENGTFYNKLMIEQGYAHEYTYRIPYKHQVDFKAAQSDAEKNKRGLWSPSTCDGNTEKGATSAAPTKQAQPKQIQQKTSAANQNCDPNYTPCIPNVSYDLDCSDIGKSVRVVGTDRHRLDRDNDGYGCESY